MRDEHFEWNDGKNEINQRRHGISFEKARDLWKAGVDEYPSPRPGEMRYVAFGQLDDKLYVVVLTYAGYRRRLISAREATPEEKERYENEKQKQKKSGN